MTTSLRPPPRVPTMRTVAVTGAVVTGLQALVLITYLVAVILSFGLALFVFFIPLFVWLFIGWWAGNNLIPAPIDGRRWIALFPSAPISLVATWLGVKWALAIMGDDHDWGWAYLVDLVLIVGFAAVIGAACWSLIGLLVRSLLTH